MIVVVDYGMGNLGSVLNMLKKVGAENAVLSSDLDVIKNANKLILPGVGHFAKGVENLNKSGIADVLHDAVIKDKKPIMGICLGMQLMARQSEEGHGAKGLGWIDAEIVGFNKLENFSFNIPHMGWGIVRSVKDTPITKGLEDLSKFYHVHSYFMPECEHQIFQTHYGKTFVSGFQKDNVIGVQFHPEKSHKFGMQLMKNFAAL